MKLTTLAFTLTTLLLSQASLAIGDNAGELQQKWDIAKYQTEDKAREKALEQLTDEARLSEQQHPDDAEVLVWEAIILSSYAGEKGGLGALSLVKEAKRKLEAAEKINPQTLNGSIYTSLGSLYYQVPGWPLGFGDDDLAERNLQKALQIAPEDIDANFFYGDFMLEEGEYRKAIIAFEKALNAPPRAGRKIADIGRKEEIRAKLALAQKKL